MTDDLETQFLQHGFVTRPQALDSGFDDRAIHRMIRAGHWSRIGPGLYAGADYPTLTTEQQHLVRCRAVATRFDGTVVFAGQSAALAHGIAVWGLPLDDVHVNRLDTGRGRLQAGVRHHVASLADDEITEVNGLLVTSPARTVWDIAVAAPREPALVIADSALHLGLADDDELVELSRRHRSWRGAARAKVTLSLADGAAESPGETRTRYAVREFGLPAPVLQFELFDENGVLVARVDFAWPEFRHLAEFDGLKKYGTADDLAREKAREDAVRALAWGLTRIIWSQLSPGQRRALGEHLRAAMRQSQRLYGPLAS